MPKRKTTPIDKKVGKQLKKARTYRGLSQEELADEVGLTFQQIQKYEKGSNRVAISRLYELANTLELPITYFVETLPPYDTKPLPTLTPAEARYLRHLSSASPALQKQIMDMFKGTRKE